MAKYLVEANYVGDGIKGLLKEGGASRRAAVEEAAKTVGGSVEAFCYAFGETDAYVIIDVPDNVTAAGLALTIAASGTGLFGGRPVLQARCPIRRAARVNPSAGKRRATVPATAPTPGEHDLPSVTFSVVRESPDSGEDTASWPIHTDVVGQRPCAASTR